MSLLPLLLGWTLLLLIHSGGGSLHSSSPRNESLSSASSEPRSRSPPAAQHHHHQQLLQGETSQRTAAAEEEEDEMEGDSQECASCALARMRRSREAEREERRRSRRSSEQEEQQEDEVEVVEAVKRHILNMLHLHSRPNVTRPVPRAALLNALRKLHVGRVAEDGSVHIYGEGGEEEEEEAARADEERRRRAGGRRGGGGGGGDAARDLQDSTEIITFAEAGESQGLVNFVLSRESGGEQLTLVEQANVWLFLRLAKSANRSRAKVSIRLYQQPPPSSSATPGGVTTEEVLLAEKTVDTRRSGWHTFAVSPAVQGLLERRRGGGGGGDAERSTERRGGATLRLRVSCPLCAEAGATPILVSPAGDASTSPRASQREQSHRPFLMAVVRPGGEEEEGGRRGARSRRGLECDGKVHVCCKRHFYVNFKDIGWNDWIIAPPGYHANYCEGECPSHVASVTGSTLSFHSTVINHYRMRGYSPFQSLRSCCVPTRLRAMSMLYYNEEQKIVKKDIHNMIVEECGCS